MSIILNEEEKMIAVSARQFLEGSCSPTLVRKMEVDPLGYSPELWQQAADLGWIGMCLPENVGGSEMPLSYLGLVLREVGRAVAPLPLLSTSVAAITIARNGSDAQKQAILPPVVEGKSILTFAFTESDPQIGPDAISMIAKADGDDFILSGIKLFVDNFAVASKILVVARTGGAGADGISLFVVDTDAKGIASRDLVTLAKDRQNEVTFTNVRVPRANLIGVEGGAWGAVKDMLDLGTILICALMVGATRQDIEMAFDYAKMRTAFGQPIGGFQSVQHMCADMVIWTDGGELLTFEALWKMDRNLPASVEVSQAKSFCNDRCVAAVRNSQIIHGGIGFMMEFDLHLWFRRVSAWALRMGNSLEHRARIAAALIDSPGKVVLGRPLSLPGESE